MQLDKDCLDGAKTDTTSSSSLVKQIRYDDTPRQGTEDAKTLPRWFGCNGHGKSKTVGERGNGDCESRIYTMYKDTVY